VEGRFDTAGYLSTQGDIVALMVFEHQMHATNLLVRVDWDARVAQVAQNLDVAAGPLRDAIDELVDYFRFVDEAPLTAKVAGDPAFAEPFSAAGPHDYRGRSLGELDMTTRMMRYPCSYMIYSAAFDGLPTVVRDANYRRMCHVLSGRTRRLGTRVRPARIAAPSIEILRETKQNLPDYFRLVGIESGEVSVTYGDVPRNAIGLFGHVDGNGTIASGQCHGHRTAAQLHRARGIVPDPSPVVAAPALPRRVL
jgi:hypothetical protein